MSNIYADESELENQKWPCEKCNENFPRELLREIMGVGFEPKFVCLTCYKVLIKEDDTTRGETEGVNKE